MKNYCKEEIIKIHEFFEKWLNGITPSNREELKKIDETLSDAFQIISPNGNRSDKPKLLADLMKSHGIWNGKEIWIKNIECRLDENNACLMMYEEWQGFKNSDKNKGRLSSALFKKSGNGEVRWFHLHEVWLP